MSWHYLPERGEGYSQAKCLDGTPYAPARLSDTQESGFSTDSEKATSTDSQYGMMSGHSAAGSGPDQLMLFPVDSPAKTYPRRASVQDLPEPVADFGRSMLESLGRLGLDLSLRKTARSCEPVALAPSSTTLTAWGMTHDGVCWELGISARPTAGTECGYLPTPSGTRSGKNHVVGRLDEWGGSSNPFRGTSLGNLRCVGFEEWMLGWPVGWSKPTPLETGKYQSWLRQHGIS